MVGLAWAGATLAFCDDVDRPSALAIPSATGVEVRRRFSAQTRLGILWPGLLRVLVAGRLRPEKGNKDGAVPPLLGPADKAAGLDHRRSEHARLPLLPLRLALLSTNRDKSGV